MSGYTPDTDEVRDSLVYLNKYHAKQYGDVDLLVVGSETAAQFDRMIAEVERAAAARALAEAATEEERVSQQYERTADGMREREEWADSNRYANYAAGHAASAHALRKRAAALGLTAGQGGEHDG